MTDKPTTIEKQNSLSQAEKIKTVVKLKFSKIKTNFKFKKEYYICIIYCTTRQ